MAILDRNIRLLSIRLAFDPYGHPFDLSVCAFSLSIAYQPPLSTLTSSSSSYAAGLLPDRTWIVISSVLLTDLWVFCSRSIGSLN